MLTAGRGRDRRWRPYFASVLGVVASWREILPGRFAALPETLRV